MPRSVKIGIDGIEFEVPALNIDQLQRVARAIQAGGSDSGFDVLRIALERATPKPDLQSLAPDILTMGKQVREILTMSGLQQPDANPPVEPTQSL